MDPVGHLNQMSEAFLVLERARHVPHNFGFDARDVLFQAGDAAGFDGLGGAGWEEGGEAAPEVGNLVAGEPGDGWKRWC